MVIYNFDAQRLIMHHYLHSRSHSRKSWPPIGRGKL